MSDAGLLLSFSVKHHFDPEDCTKECGFELQVTLALCNLAGSADEDSYRDCLESHFVPDHVSK